MSATFKCTWPIRTRASTTYDDLASPLSLGRAIARHLQRTSRPQTQSRPRTSLSQRALASHLMGVTQRVLFERGPKLPEGLLFEPDFLTVAEDNELIDVIRALPFGEVRMH